MKKSKIIIGFPLLIALTMLIMPSCKKYSDPPSYFETNADTVTRSQRKVLIIGIDGAVGSEYKAIQPPVLVGLEAHSKFSWEAVSDESTTDAASWETLMTGVSFERHQISDSSFIYTQPLGAGEHDIITSYPSFFTYLLTSARADTKTAFISSWGNMLNRLVPEVDDKVLANNDQGVKDSALVRVKNVKSDLVVVHFNSPAIAGRTGGFSAGSPIYKDAVLKVDGYVGELMTALKARPDYNKKEEWLVIITGTHGGSGNSYGGPSAKESNVFSFYYNENMQKKELVKEGVFSGVQIKNQGTSTIKATLQDPNNVYNPGTGEQTIQIKVNGSAGSYPHFFSKEAVWPSTPGWSMFSSGGNWNLSVRSTTSAENRIQGAGPNVFDGNWHTITVVFADSASKKWVRRYTDGIRISQTDITSIYSGGGTISSSSPLTIGWQADPSMPAVTFYPADVMIFNKALTDAEIANGLCLKDITMHPKYANLIGYWPGSDGYGGRIKNMAPGTNGDFLLSGAFQWDGLTNLPCTIASLSDPSKESRLVKSVDLVPNVFYWMRVTINSSWPIESTEWLSKYESEFVKL